MYNPSQTTWLNPNIEYLFNDEIIEYDIRDAGFSIIKEFGLLPKEEIMKLAAIGKGLERHILIGKMQRDNKELSAALLNKFTEVRDLFIQFNNLNDDRIISVKKDAIFTINPCKRTRFGEVIFAEKNRYTSYMRFSSANNIELYYADGNIDVKGMGDGAVNRHRLYMLEFISKIIPLIETHDSRARRLLKRFISQYKSMSLEDGYYLEFNSLSRDINPIFNFQRIIIPLVQIVLKEIPQ